MEKEFFYFKLINSQNNTEQYGKGYPSESGFTLVKGIKLTKSRAPINNANKSSTFVKQMSFTKQINSLYEKLLREGIIDSDGILLQDYEFSSPSFAAEMVTGTYMNGLTTFKNKDGKTLKSFNIYNKEDLSENIRIKVPKKITKEYNISRLSNSTKKIKLNIETEIKKITNGDAAEAIAIDFLKNKYGANNIEKISDINDTEGYDVRVNDNGVFKAFEVKGISQNKSFNLSINEFMCLYKNQENYYIIVVDINDKKVYPPLSGTEFVKQYSLSEKLYNLLKEGLVIDGTLRFNI